jgi:uncharacterized membrane protein
VINRETEHQLPQGKESVVKILDEGFAKGEITSEEFRLNERGVKEVTSIFLR